MVLRFLAIWKNWDVENGILNGYKGRMKSFLNAFMNDYKEIKGQEANEWKRLFEETVEKVYQVYGEYAFKRQGLDGMREKTINRAIIDVIMLSATQHPKDELIANKDKIAKRFIEMTNNDMEFRNSIKIGTSDTKVITLRLSTWCNEVNRIIAG